MGFKSLFKVRKPGNGNAVQASFARASKESKARKFPIENNSQNSSGKTQVK